MDIICLVPLDTMLSTKHGKLDTLPKWWILYNQVPVPSTEAGLTVVLFRSRSRSEGWPQHRHHFLHLFLSSVTLTDSSTGSPGHVLMLSIQAVRGLPRLRAPGIVPCIISFSRQLPRFLIV